MYFDLVWRILVLTGVSCSKFARQRYAELKRDFFIDNLLVRIHCIIVIIGWTGLATWIFKSLTSKPGPGGHAVLRAVGNQPKVDESPEMTRDRGSKRLAALDPRVQRSTAEGGTGVPHP